jgi:hypothetical protein
MGILRVVPRLIGFAAICVVVAVLAAVETISGDGPPPGWAG